MSPITIVLVQRDSNLKQVKLSTWSEPDLYKKAGFKTEKDFGVHCNFVLKSKKHIVSVYGKTNGKSNTENKYDFPPPIDNTLFFGSCVLVKKDRETNIPENLTIEEWRSIYEYLFGGFEDLNGGGLGMIVADMLDKKMDEMEMSEEERRILNDPSTRFTKDGYVKDDFIVSDESDAEEDDDDDEVPLPPRRKGSNVNKKRQPRSKKTVDSPEKSEKADQDRDSQTSNPLSESKNMESIKKQVSVEHSPFSDSLPKDDSRPFRANKSSKGKISSIRNRTPQKPKSSMKPKTPRAPRKKSAAPPAVNTSSDVIEDSWNNDSATFECKEELIEEEYFK